MAYVPTKLAQNAENSTSETTIYTVPAGATTIVKQLVLANTTGSSAQYSVSLVPSGGSAAAANRIMDAISIPADSITTVDLSQVMDEGDFISILQGTAASVTITVSGVEVDPTPESGITIRKDGGSDVGTRPRINFIEGSNVTLTVADDNTDNEVDVTIAASGGGGSGATQSFVGYNTIGGTMSNMTNRVVLLKKITVASDSLLLSVDAYVDSGQAGDNVGGFMAGYHADNTGTPGALLGYSSGRPVSVMLDGVNGAGGDTTGRWFSLPIGAWVTAGDYWVAFMAMGSMFRIAKDGSGSDRFYTSGADWMTDAGWYTVSTGTDKHSIRANLLTP